MTCASADDEYDVIVFGSGAAAMTAAFVCAHEGLRTVLCEKSDKLGGTTATSGGVAWVPLNSHARRAGFHDTRDSALRFLCSELGSHLRDDLLDAYLDGGARAIDYLAANSEVKFELSRIPDYHDMDGHAADVRSLSPLAFNGRRLGADFGLVRPPWPQFLVLGGLMVGRRDIHSLLKPFASFSAFRRVCRILGRHALDRVRYPRGTHLLMGNALIARFLYSLRQENVTILTNTRLVSLERQGPRVRAAFVEANGQRRRIAVRLGIVLGTGGFPQNRDLRDALMPEYPHEHSVAFEANTGDAVLAARAVGASVDKDLASPAFWTACTVLEQSGIGKVVYPYGHLDRGKPGLIIVDETGKRFVNESDSYHDVALALIQRGRESSASARAFQVFDRRFLWEYGLGFIRPMALSVRKFIKSGYLVRAQTIGELAAALGIEPSTLVETVARHNRFCAAGVDEDFGKGSTAFNRYNGDPRVDGNPCLAPIVKSPFYAVALYPGTLGTSVGLRTDGLARVLGENDIPIEGLYACGNDMGSVVRGTYPGAGITIGPAITFGFLAAQHLAERGVRQSVTEKRDSSEVSACVQRIG